MKSFYGLAEPDSLFLRLNCLSNIFQDQSVGLGKRRRMCQLEIIFG